MTKERKLVAKIKDIDLNRVTGYFGEYLLDLLDKPIDAEYGRKLKEQRIADIYFYEQEYDYLGNITKEILIGEFINI